LTEINPRSIFTTKDNKSWWPMKHEINKYIHIYTFIDKTVSTDIYTYYLGERSSTSFFTAYFLNYARKNQ